MGMRGRDRNSTIKPNRRLCPRIGRFSLAVSVVRMRRPDLFAFAASATIPAPLSVPPVRTDHRSQGNEVYPSIERPPGRMSCLIENVNL